MDLTTIVTDLFIFYRECNFQYPILSSMATASVIFPAADILSQLIVDKTVNWQKVKYTTGLAPLYGLYGYGSVQMGGVVEKFISADPLAKAALGPNLIGNVFNLVFFVNNAVGEKKGYQLQGLGSYYTSLCSGKERFLNYVPRKEYIQSVIGTVTFWNAFQYLNYSYISDEMQTPTTLGVAFGWTVLLSFWSQIGRKKRGV